jgi:hypothetical protein
VGAEMAARTRTRKVARLALAARSVLPRRRYRKREVESARIESEAGQGPSGRAASTAPAPGRDDRIRGEPVVRTGDRRDGRVARLSRNSRAWGPVVIDGQAALTR